MNIERPGTVLVVGFVLVIGLLTLVTGIALSGIANVNEQLERVVGVDSVRTSALGTMQRSSRERSMLLYQMTAAVDPFEKDELFKKYQEKGSEFLRARERLLNVELKGEELALLEEQQTLAGAIVAAQKKAMAVLEEGDAEEAQHILLDKALPPQDEMLAVLDRLMHLQHMKADATVRRSTEDVSSTFNSVIPLALLAALLSFLITSAVARRISHMVEDLKRTSHELQTSNEGLRIEIKKRTYLAKVIKDNEARERAIRENILDAVITTDAGGIIGTCNPVVEQMFGYTSNELIGANVSILMPEPHRSTHDSYMANYLETHEAKVIGIGRELIAQRKDGSLFPVELGVTEVPFEGKPMFVGVIRDITERKEAEQALQNAHYELEQRVEERTAELQTTNAQLNAEIAERQRIQEKLAHMAGHDSLTGLPNRALFNELLKQVTAEARRWQYQAAVFFMDLDGFKAINDSLGHDAGDQVLVNVAERLTMCVREEDPIARIGGDEFVLLASHFSQINHVEAMAERIINSIEQPFEVKGEQCHLGVSIGVSLFPSDTKDLDTLVRYADEAMYHAKKTGKNRYVLFQKKNKMNREDDPFLYN